MNEQQSIDDAKRLRKNEQNREYRRRKKLKEEQDLLAKLKHEPKSYKDVLSKPPPISKPDFEYMSLDEYLNQSSFDHYRQAPEQPVVQSMGPHEKKLRIHYYGKDSDQDISTHQYKLRSANDRSKKYITEKCICTNDECGAHCLNSVAGELCTERNCRLHPKICKNNWMDSNNNMMKWCIPVKESEALGKGLKTSINIESGKIIGPYVGEFKSRQAKSEGTYRVDIPLKGRVKGSNMEGCIDSAKRGNILRFINHSCLPNCEFIKKDVYGVETLWVKSIKEIKAGKFLSMNYNKKFDPCFCEACI